MDKVIDTKQLSNLNQEMQGLTRIYKRYEFVDCIYFVPYDCGNSTLLLLNVIVQENEKASDAFNKDIDRRNDFYSSRENINRFGGRIFIESCSAKDYRSENVNIDKVRELLSAFILYDSEDKHYSKTVQQLSEGGEPVKPYSNVLSIKIGNNK